MLWLLPLLLMRLLLPSGVMPARASLGFALVLCSAQHAPSTPDPGRGHADALCPFAAAATPAPPASLMPAAIAAMRSSLALLACHARGSGQGGVGAQPARSGPTLIRLKPGRW